VLLLDEPSAGLNEHETESLATLLRELASTGLAVLLVEHDMGLVMSASDQIYVLDFGRIIAVGDPAKVQADPLVRAAYLGEGDEEAEVPVEQRELRNEIVVDLPVGTRASDGSAPHDHPGELAIELADVRAAYGTIDVLHGVTLQIRPKQVFALLGPNGAGKSTTLRVASGQMRPSRRHGVGLRPACQRVVCGPARSERDVHHPRRARGATARWCGRCDPRWPAWSTG